MAGGANRIVSFLRPVGTGACPGGLGTPWGVGRPGGLGGAGIEGTPGGLGGVGGNGAPSGIMK